MIAHLRLRQSLQRSSSAAAELRQSLQRSSSAAAETGPEEPGERSSSAAAELRQSLQRSSSAVAETGPEEPGGSTSGGNAPGREAQEPERPLPPPLPRKRPVNSTTFNKLKRSVVEAMVLQSLLQTLSVIWVIFRRVRTASRFLT